MTTVTQSYADELNITTADLQDIYNYLDRLRESGETNMYGAAPYIREEFDFLYLSKAQARDILGSWMKDFS